MIIIGITGGIGHGKTTIARAFVKQTPNSKQFETYELVAEVANQLHQASAVPKSDSINDLNKFIEPLPDILRKVTHAKCTASDINIAKADITRDPAQYEKLFVHVANLKADPNLINQTISNENKDMFRPILQWLGGYLATKLEDIWYKELLRRIRATNFDLVVIGGVRFPADERLVHKEGGLVLEIMRPGYNDTDVLDPTERMRKQIRSDAIIINDGTIDDLNKAAMNILDDIQKSILRPQYRATKAK